ncbi:pyruvate/2-oxoglutarate dehydrogenase complex dihydrolipoamide dehydrogenase (E3) component [Mucilaginibacter gracilis]|uniref:Pyruvate/2-oxoglutarate dehydrogenase complex dihydrolipoamide dehydrogenase (E3) component n=1 Tax=Mucilaginibacter gracilis TaxID=423350 RepID=A0A495IU08_9SPHI|nr:mercuric reductase [Mucilaginibacter gracilis]RKR80160.1 pyruvate/2-oxoglutarate dehydrogenase complex dihydrolipoamide dehydrogenase (E3) component [Mucilaginibacter gracilis]
MKTYDAIVIGSGQAGTPLAKRLAMAGKKTAIFEKGLVGGTCINNGCTPTKAMIASAKLAYNAAKCDDMGIHIKGFTVDLPLIKKRKDGIVKTFHNGAQKGLEGTKGLDLIFGEAVFTGAKTISVKLTDGGTEEYTADLIFINTGAKTIIPNILGLNNIDYLTSTSILELETVPQHLLIIGASYIGMEFGQMFRRFGSEVTMLEASPRALPKEDEDVSEEIVNILQGEGITFYADAKASLLGKKTNGEIEAELLIAGKKKHITCSHILIATGRKPQTEALQLQKAGVTLDEKGYVKVNQKLETNIKGIYALGDVKPGPAFTHVAYNDYTIVHRNIVAGANLSIKDRLIPYCMFTDPPLGRVGITEAEAQKLNINYKVAKLPMEHVARAIEVGETRGFMKAIVNADTKKILGVAILGQEGGEIMSVMQMAMMGGITYDEIRFMMFAHPIYSESLNNLFMKLES